MKILLSALAVILCAAALILFAKVGISVKYRDGARVYVHIGIFKINTAFFNRSKKAKKQSLRKALEQNRGENGDKNSGDTAFAANLSAKSADSGEYPTSDKDGLVSEDKAQSRRISQTDEKIARNAKAEENKSADKGRQSALSDFTYRLKGTGVREILEILSKTLSELKEPFSKYAEIQIKRLEITAGGTDAAQTAVMYGIYSCALEALLDICGEYRIFKLNRKKVGVYYDFTSYSTEPSIEIKLSMRAFRLILCAIPALRGFMSLKAANKQG